MKMKYTGIAGIAALLLTACNDTKYELGNLVPDEYHNVLYINNSGTQDLTLYNTGEANTYTISVYKGGSDPSLAASVDLGVYTQEEVDLLYSAIEGVDYRIIPAGSYALDQAHLDFTSEDRYKVVTLSLETELIEAAIEANPEVTYVLPLRLYSENDSINTAKSELFIRMTEVLTPTVGFTGTTASSLSYTYGFASESVDINFGLDTDNSWDIDCRFAADPDYVATYNAANGTSYTLLPEGSYSFEETVALPSGANTTKLTVAINGSGLKHGEYLLPIRLTGVSFFDVSENVIYPLVIRVVGVQFARTGWTIEANTEERTGEGAGNGVATCLLDGNLSTFWHSQWQGGSVPLPHELIVDVKKEVTFTNIGLAQRQHGSYRDVRNGELFVSSDKTNWTSVGTFKAEQILETQIFSVTPTKGRYFKIRITSSNRDANSALAEVYAYGIE
ncbi:MAG: DUF1735 domain-containing protein [Tannerellaceae bacterium]|nr:DUF1735 domain-containing protein [Tannerellaceae bacterium]